MVTKGLWSVSAIWTSSIGRTGCAGSSGSLRERRESMRRLAVLFFDFEVDWRIVLMRLLSTWTSEVSWLCISMGGLFGKWADKF